MKILTHVNLEYLELTKIPKIVSKMDNKTKIFLSFKISSISKGAS